MKFGTCKLCNQESALARAHIVPKAFYHFLPQEPLMLFSGKIGSRPKRLPAGTYDEGLLCNTCEEALSNLDDEAARILKPWPRRSQMLKDENGFILKLESRKAGYLIKAQDTDKLLLFFDFLLWRMAKTNRPEMRLNLEAGLVEELRKSVLTRTPSNTGLRVHAARSPDRAASIVANPRIGVIDGRTVVNLDFCGFQFKIMPSEAGIDEFALTSGRDWWILFQSFRETKLYPALSTVAKRNPNPWARLQAKRKRNG